MLRGLYKTRNLNCTNTNNIYMWAYKVVVKVGRLERRRLAPTMR
jgi:hypothetical protein